MRPRSTPQVLPAQTDLGFAPLSTTSTDTPLAASETMWVVLKTYAADGENGLHAHPSEDHTFVVLLARPLLSFWRDLCCPSGEATFYGPNDETRTIGKNFNL